MPTKSRNASKNILYIPRLLENSFDSYADDIKKARAEAIDAKKRLQQIDNDSNSDPAKRQQYKEEVDRIAKNADKWRGVVQVPERTGFWHKLLGINDKDGLIHEEANSRDADKHRLEVANLRQEFEIAQEEARVTAEIAKDVTINPEDFDLKSFSYKSNNKIEHLLDIIIGRFDRILALMGKKSFGTTSTTLTTDIKMKNVKYASSDEQSAVHAAVNYYKEMSSTLNGEVNIQKSSTSKKGILDAFRRDEVPQEAKNILEEGNITDADLNQLDMGDAPPEEVVEYVDAADPYALETLGTDMQKLEQTTNGFEQTYAPDVPEQTQDKLISDAQQAVLIAKGLEAQINALPSDPKRGGISPEEKAAYLEQVRGIQDQFSGVVANPEDMFYDPAAASYSKSAMIAMKNYQYPILVGTKAMKPGDFKRVVHNLAAGLGDKVRKLKNKAKKLRETKVKLKNGVEKNAKKKSIQSKR